MKAKPARLSPAQIVAAAERITEAEAAAKLAKAGAKRVRCAWFALCTRAATRLRECEALGAMVPICGPCDEKIKRIDNQTRKDDR